MRTDDLLLLPADEIEYASLDSQRLLGLATQVEEPFIATNALTELRMRAAEEADVAARLLVREQATDRHLRALAVSMLFDRDLEQDVPLLMQAVSSTTDPALLSAAIEGIEQEGAALEGPGADELLQVLVRQLRVARPDRFTDTALWSKFLAQHATR